MSLSKLGHFDCDKLVDCGDYSPIIQGPLCSSTVSMVLCQLRSLIGSLCTNAGMFESQVRDFVQSVLR